MLDDAGFQAAALTAVLLSLVALVMGRGRAVRGAPAVAVIAALVGYSVDNELRGLLVMGLALLAVGAWLGDSWGPAAVGVGLAIPGAVLVAVSLPERAPTWVGIVTFGAVVLAGRSVDRFDQRAPRFAAAFLMVAAAAIYVCVPETDPVRPLLGAFGVTALLALFPRLAMLPGAAMAAAGLLCWSAAAGGYPRPGSVVGALACVGVAALSRAIVALRGTRRWIAAGVAVALVVYCARVAGLFDSAWAAAGLALLGFVIATAALALMFGTDVFKLTSRER